VRIGVVGGGIIGCAIAWRLARQGVDVTIFEQRCVGAGATHASAGALVPYVEAHEPGPLQDLVVRSLNLYDQFIAELREESPGAVDYARCGSLEVAFSPPEEDFLRSVAHRHAAAGLRWIDAAETLRLEPALSPAIRGSLAADHHGYVSAPGLTAALAKAVSAFRGVFRDARVIQVSGSSGMAEIATDSGAVESFDRVVIASGAWARMLDVEGRDRPPVRPVKGQLLRVRGVRVKRLVWSRPCYLVPQATGEVLVGATMEDAGFDERPTASGVAHLLDAAIGLVPSLAQAEFVDVRAGLRPATPDHLPMVGFPRGAASVLYATGHFRNGIVLAPLTARIVADVILDGVRDPALDLLSPERFGL
jgi:glycine oxidase